MLAIATISAISPFTYRISQLSGVQLYEHQAVLRSERFPRDICFTSSAQEAGMGAGGVLRGL